MSLILIFYILFGFGFVLAIYQKEKNGFWNTVEYLYCFLILVCIYPVAIGMFVGLKMKHDLDIMFTP